MTIDTTKVAARRSLRFSTLSEVLADAERLADADVEMLGNWSLGQVLAHLAIAVNGSIDGFPFRESWIVRLVARLLLKRRMLTHGVPPGYGRSSRWQPVRPEPTTVANGLAALRAAIKRLDKEPTRAAHPAFGPMSREEWDQFHLRHAALHLSFARPKT